MFIVYFIFLFLNKVFDFTTKIHSKIKYPRIYNISLALLVPSLAYIAQFYLAIDPIILLGLAVAIPVALIKPKIDK